MDEYTAPTCPECGTVLVDGCDGLECRHCLTIVPYVDVERPDSDLPSIRGG